MYFINPAPMKSNRLKINGFQTQLFLGTEKILGICLGEKPKIPT